MKGYCARLNFLFKYTYSKTSWVTERHTMNYANHYGYSDVNPYEVVKVISDKTIEVREMDSEKDPSWVPNWHVGGFAGHCSNQQEQKWFIKSNAENPVVRIRLGKQGWKDKHGRKFDLSDKPVRFYDYNF